MQKSSLEPLLNRAKELEKKYEWLQAARIYQKALTIALKNEDLAKVVELCEWIGFCYYRAAFQAERNIEFNERLRLAIQAYNKEIKILSEQKAVNKEVRIKHSEALVAHNRSWLETSASKRKELLDEWWTLENQVLEAYESIGDVHSAGIVCNEMLEFSTYTQIWLTDFSEWVRLEKESLKLIDKSIRSLSESGDDYELARAYCLAGIRFSWGLASVESVDKRLQLTQSAQDYSKKALEIAQKIGAARLIGYSYISLMNITGIHVDNHKLALKYGEEVQKYGSITKDKFLVSYAMGVSATVIERSVIFMEDPDKKRESLKRARKLAQNCRRLAKIINHAAGVCNGFLGEIDALMKLAEIETDPKNKQRLLEIAIEIHQEGFEFFKEWKRFSIRFYPPLNASLVLLAETKNDVEEKKTLLLEAQSNSKKFLSHHKEMWPYNYGGRGLAYYNLGQVQHEIAKIESKNREKIKLLQKARVSLEKSNELTAKSHLLYLDSSFAKGVLWKHNYKLGEISQQLYSITKEDKTLSKAIKAFKIAAGASEKAELPLHLAESNWHIALLLNQRGRHQEASQRYEAASSAYDNASKKIPQLKEFYENYSIYMRAWSQIEQARYAHSVEDHKNAKNHYEKAAKLHKSVESWSYLAHNYFAWASIEEAESLSRKENTKQAKLVFQKALDQFSKAEESIREKLKGNVPVDEKEMAQRLLKASDLKKKYCQARILLEEAKSLDKEGKYLQSSKRYGEAAENVSAIVEKAEVEAERKELEYLASLCQAWQKMAKAEETTSPESYLEAAKLFEKAKEYCYTKKASLWTLGNSSFCKGLAAKNQFQSTFEKSYHSMANKHVEQAAAYYRRAGFQAASEYAKATQRLLDAYVYMHCAQEEVDPEKKTKFYQLSEQLLQIATGLFMKAKQPEKTALVHGILATVREEKALAASLNEVMHAPTITSSTMTFTAPSPTSEVSVGLEQFQHANVQANLIAASKEVKVGESFCLTLEFVNAGKEPALLIRVEDFVPPDFIVVKKPEIYRLEESCLNMKGKQIAPLKLVEAKAVLQPSKKGVYELKPTIHYLDELGQSKSLQLKSIEIKVEEVILADRVSTGTKELDSLLLGGIPKEYAVVLTGPPSDERELIVKNFLEAGTKKGQISFYVTSEAVGIESLLEKSGFYLFLCNPKPKVEVPDLPNISRLRSKTDLTNLNIALLKAYRNTEPSIKKRVCLDVVSDVLLRHGAEATRRWISELTTDMVSKGFTVLAVINPGMHPSDQATAVVDLFDGEISLYQTEDSLECKKSLRIKKLRNQDYIKNPICLTKSAV